MVPTLGRTDAEYPYAVTLQGEHSVGVETGHVGGDDGDVAHARQREELGYVEAPPVQLKPAVQVDLVEHSGLPWRSPGRDDHRQDP
jgi:hypothetical protein